MRPILLCAVLSGLFMVAACLVFPYPWRSELLVDSVQRAWLVPTRSPATVQLPAWLAPPRHQAIDDPELALGALAWLALDGRKATAVLHDVVAASPAHAQVLAEIRTRMPQDSPRLRGFGDFWRDVDDFDPTSWPEVPRATAATAPLQTAYIEAGYMLDRAGLRWSLQRLPLPVDAWVAEASTIFAGTYDDPTVKLQRALDRYLAWRGAPEILRTALLALARSEHARHSPIGDLRHMIHEESGGTPELKAALAQLEKRLQECAHAAYGEDEQRSEQTQRLHRTHGMRFLFLASLVTRLGILLALVLVAGLMLHRRTPPEARVIEARSRRDWLAWVCLLGSAPAGLVVGEIYDPSHGLRAAGVLCTAALVAIGLTLAILRSTPRAATVERASRLQHLIAWLVVAAFAGLLGWIFGRIAAAEHVPARDAASQPVLAWLVLALVALPFLVLCWRRPVDELRRWLGRAALAVVVLVTVLAGVTGVARMDTGLSGNARDILLHVTMWTLGYWLLGGRLRARGWLRPWEVDTTTLVLPLAAMLFAGCLVLPQHGAALWPASDFAAMLLAVPALHGALWLSSWQCGADGSLTPIDPGAAARTWAAARALAGGLLYLSACVLVLACVSRQAILGHSTALRAHFESVW